MGPGIAPPLPSPVRFLVWVERVWKDGVPVSLLSPFLSHFRHSVSGSQTAGLSGVPGHPSPALPEPLLGPYISPWPQVAVIPGPSPAGAQRPV